MADTMDVMRLVAMEAVKEMVTKNLSLRIEERTYEGSVEIQMMYGKEPIGDPVYIGVHTETDHRHNFDHVCDVSLTGS